MISIQTNNGDLVKVLHNVENTEFGFHKLFGFISFDKAEERVATRKKQAYDFTENKWNFTFKIKTDGKAWKITDATGCKVEKAKNGWTLSTALGDFKLVNSSDAMIAPLLEEHEEVNDWFNKAIRYMVLFSVFLVPVFYFLNSETAVEEKKEEEVIKPITVKVIQKTNVVQISNNLNPQMKVKPLTKEEIAHRAVQRNLGFLGMVGSKDMKKVVGGVPQKLEKATAGAGKGGDAGSGGELLTGLGKGLKKTTVGNTGVQGLGGVGTKGAGGGAGGYGNTMVASGSGKGISAIAVSNSDMAVEGGLSRYAINATIAKYLSQIRRCYENRLKLNPSLQGLVEVSFMINGSGNLDFAKVSRTTLKDSQTETCITTKMMGWEFPKPKGGVKVPVKYPFMLRPVGK